MTGGGAAAAFACTVRVGPPTPPGGTRLRQIVARATAYPCAVVVTPPDVPKEH